MTEPTTIKNARFIRALLDGRTIQTRHRVVHKEFFDLSQDDALRMLTAGTDTWLFQVKPLEPKKARKV